MTQAVAQITPAQVIEKALRLAQMAAESAKAYAAYALSVAFRV
jgi:hypothetical protein